MRRPDQVHAAAAALLGGLTLTGCPCAGERSPDPFVRADAALGAEAFVHAGRPGRCSATHHPAVATTHAVLRLVLEDLASVRTPDLRTDVSRLPLERFPNVYAANAIAADADTCEFLLEALIAGFTALREQADARRPRGKRADRR